MNKELTDMRIKSHSTFIVAEPVKQDLWDAVLSQLDDVAQRLELNPGIHTILRQPERELIVSVPVTMDDGQIQVFTQRFFWGQEEINCNLERIMVRSFEKVWNFSMAQKVPLRLAAYMLAVEKVAAAIWDRGIFP